jgi:hypothetical protein
VTIPVIQLAEPHSFPILPVFLKQLTIGQG